VANHPQAKKRNRQRLNITARNRHIRATLRTYVKRVRTAVESAEKRESASVALQQAIKHLDKAVTKGILKRKTASRTISRLTVAVNKLSA
jgi:small subunit ribosomal protein S20